MENRKRIGIITITDGANYGNRLQNYALQEVLRSIGADVQTFKIKSSKDTKTKIAFFKDIVKSLLCRRSTMFLFRKRMKLFSDFNKQYIAFSKEIHDSTPTKFDYFVCGSDQIWNTEFSFIKENINLYLASFARPEQRVAYAASFGKADMNFEEETLFRRELPLFHSLGMREKSGMDFANQFGNRRDAMVVLDPTLLLDRNDWTAIEKKPKYLESHKYIATYFLGEKTNEVRRKIEEMAELCDAEVVNLTIEFMPDNEIKNVGHFLTSPDEFIWLIHNAECVVTDSYHACIFSFIFDKPFIVCNRAWQGTNMNTRMDTFLSTFSLQQKWFCAEKTNEYLEHNYGEGYAILQNEKEKSTSFLKKALGE